MNTPDAAMPFPVDNRLTTLKAANVMPSLQSTARVANPLTLPPILYGYLGNGYDKGLGRQGGLTEAFSQLTPVILLKRTPFSAASPKFLPTLQHLHENLFVVHNAFALRYSRVGRRLGKFAGLLDGRWLNTVLARAGLSGYIYWLTDSSPSMLWGMPTDRLVYDCIDPCFVPEDQPRFDRQEFQVARRAKVVFATADTLAHRMRSVNPHVHLLPNACSSDTFEAPPVSFALDELPMLRGRPRPVVGCMSTYDWRFDADIVFQAAKFLPDLTFALVGRVNPDQEHRIRRLRSLPNVLFPGAVSYDDGFRWTAAFDIGLIPFLPGEISDAINPVKMYMYLAAGKPVVSTHIHECVSNASFVRAARSPEELVAAICAASDDATPEAAAKRRAFARRNRWEDRALAAARILHQEGFAAQ